MPLGDLGTSPPKLLCQCSATDGRIRCAVFLFIILVEFACPCARWLLEENLYGDNERLLDVRTPYGRHRMKICSI
jgi:hypothetical protein